MKLPEKPKTKKTKPSPPPELEVGSRWRRRRDGNVARVIAVAEGHVMARFPRCMVWAKHWTEIAEEFELVAPAKKKKQ